MKILVICQYYYPEPFRLNDICEELVNQGHEVTVVTGLPNYPMGEIYNGYKNGEKRNEIVNGVKVHRCSIIPRKKGALYRFLNYYSYVISSSFYIGKVKHEYDVVFVYQLSPVMMAYAGIKYAKKWGKRMVIYCLDIWPESLLVGKIKKGSAIYNLLHRTSAKIYKAADKILISSRAFSAYFKSEFGIKETEYLPQYAEELYNPEECKKEPNGCIDLMFAGNIGEAQSVKTIIRAAVKCKYLDNLRWHIVGDGVELENCKMLADNLKAPVIFHGRKPTKEMPKYYSMADAMIVTMEKNDALSRTLPGKIQSYMAAGKPILGAIGGETQKIIKESNCGFCCDAEDVEGFIEVVKKFYSADKKEIEKASFDYSNTHFRRDLFMRRICEELKTVGDY